VFVRVNEINRSDRRDCTRIKSMKNVREWKMRPYEDEKFNALSVLGSKRTIRPAKKTSER